MYYYKVEGLFLFLILNMCMFLIHSFISRLMDIIFKLFTQSCLFILSKGKATNAVHVKSHCIRLDSYRAVFRSGLIQFPAKPPASRSLTNVFTCLIVRERAQQIHEGAAFALESNALRRCLGERGEEEWVGEEVRKREMEIDETRMWGREGVRE